MQSLPGTIARGTVLADKYRVERVLGEGGMGIVVAATHLQLQQQVAIKMLLPEVARDASVVARFLEEGRSQVRIQGEHVVRVLDVGTLAGGAPFMVMELLAGCDLAKVAATRGVLPVDEAIEYVLQATEALAQAHSLGIVHRDLKPQNMFLTTRPDGSPLVKVLDFGISKNERADVPRRAATTEGRLLGSPAYMSPEQIQSPRNATTRSDIWSLGVILYELLTGRMPYEASGLAELLMAITRDVPADIRSFRPDLPPRVAAVIMSCLSRDPQLRPRDTAELAHALVLDAHGLARATRIAHIVQRFSIPPLELARTSLAIPAVASMPTAQMPCARAPSAPPPSTNMPPASTAFASPAYAATAYANAPRSPSHPDPHLGSFVAPAPAPAFPGAYAGFHLQASTTARRHELPVRRPTSRALIGVAAVAGALVLAALGTSLAMARTQAPSTASPPTPRVAASARAAPAAAPASAATAKATASAKPLAGAKK